jgi:hypothetical protein
VRNRPEVPGCHSEQQNQTIGQVLLVWAEVETMAGCNADSHANQYAGQRQVSALAFHGVTALGASAGLTASAASTVVTSSASGTASCAVSVVVMGACEREQAARAKASRT